MKPRNEYGISQGQPAKTKRPVPQYENLHLLDRILLFFLRKQKQNRPAVYACLSHTAKP